MLLSDFCRPTKTTRSDGIGQGTLFRKLPADWDEFVQNNLLCSGLITKEDRSLYKIKMMMLIEALSISINLFYSVYHSCRWIDNGAFVIRLHIEMNIYI
jgi:hypothetical protein